METIRTVPGLVEAGLIAPDATEALRPVAERYAVAVTPEMARLIDPADAADPGARLAGGKRLSLKIF